MATNIFLDNNIIDHDWPLFYFPEPTHDFSYVPEKDG